ncbi:hypothetical protein B0T16DRAFT_410171 [Cercophora newfieldiana]|uniref:Uncharacterized protein n=1 Tax=Cercophora newfieldiana TaxID=92897 RepID=A0AA40CU91_9PEZI|nr:hypothetical protein B0T16DRAFT_410171 [Cercophora newfieldiana]
MSLTLYSIASLSTIVCGLLTMAGLGWFWRKRPVLPDANGTKFVGSQIGGKSVINYSYTDMPWKLMAFDVYYFFIFIWALPHILLPITPADSGDLAELSLTRGNLFCIAIHFVLVILQLGFIVSLPLMVLLPIWTAVLAIALFFVVNHALCMLINGKVVEYHSDPKYAPALPEHAHEQWIFINGVAVGEHWMQNNLNRLALTFKRPILGIHNKTAGIIFDVVECLVQRNLGFATTDVRVCYRIIKEKLYSPQYSKVVFVLHSQGAIEGSLILDWLLQELPQDLLSKLEVYTFGNAANHFNNPHRHVHSQDIAFNNPIAASLDSAPILRTPSPNPHAAATTHAKGPHTHHPAAKTSTPSSFSVVPSLPWETSSSTPSKVSDRAIGHIEHYAHTTDFVALWGVLHFTSSAPGSVSMPRFIGRVFARTTPRGGHQLNLHYLDSMFPLEKSQTNSKEFVGCLEEGNEFMESEIVIGAEGNEMDSMREAMDVSWLARRGGKEGEREVEIHGGSPVEQKGRFRSRTGAVGVDGKRATRVKVKELSRLWQYRNGRSPEEKPPLLMRDGEGVVRTATL